MPRAILIPLAFLVVAAPATAQSITQQMEPMQQAPAPAPVLIGPTVGATVYDPAGGVVGTIDSVTPTTAVVSTGTIKGALQLSAFAKGPKGPVIALTRAQLEAAMQQASASSTERLKAQLVAGASVKGSAGNVVGTVKAADDQYVTLTTPKGEVRLPVSGFAAGPDGPMIGMTSDQLDAAVAASTPAAGK